MIWFPTECPYEFVRLRDFRPREGDTKQPSLNVVYDTPSHEKARCPSVFVLNDDGSPIVTNKGSYYKNVRKEWASLVSTPSSARFQDALAFTRSLGDLHLHTYGVTHYPEVQVLDLRNVFQSLTTTSPIMDQLSEGTLCYGFLPLILILEVSDECSIVYPCRRGYNTAFFPSRSFYAPAFYAIFPQSYTPFPPFSYLYLMHPSSLSCISSMNRHNGFRNICCILCHVSLEQITWTQYYHNTTNDMSCSRHRWGMGQLDV